MLSLNILRCEKSEFVFFNLFLTLFVLSWSVWGLGSNRYLCRRNFLQVQDDILRLQI
ncbi:hypothetical protein OIU74_007922 [Salix koriyanagi]|uniref:Uncharacterized protein n=1 Tax=Salix koriyanagi TaxID=2511006 RepID=A0A9Q0U4Q4_9ROSI|nr:hypothetical protein OIU74_007922 [Salix koriyanagi]